MKNYEEKSLIKIDKEISSLKKEVTLNGKTLTLQEIFASVNSNTKINITSDKNLLTLIAKSHKKMLEDVEYGLPVYGTNSSFGGQAARVLNEGDKDRRIKSGKKISDSLVFLDIGIGPEVPPEIVRAGITIRTNMLMRGVSGVRAETLEKLTLLLNQNLTPVVNEYGGVGASGDLTHNQRVVSVLRGLPGAKVINEAGEKEDALSALIRNNIEPLNLDPKEGLALVNGDNFSTAYASVIVKKLISYFLISEVVGAMAIEVLKGSDRSFHPFLAEIRPHPGQKESAENYRYLLKDSKLAHQELKGHKVREKGIKVQDGYSIRCLPQFEGIMIEKIKWALNIIETNANSVSDNPVWVPDEFTTEGEKPWQWVSGGNFLAMHMVEVMDSLRKIITQIIKRNDRHLSRMIDETDNNGLPANLSGKKSIGHTVFKGVQIQSGMLEIYSILLANPVSTLFGIHEERNQDITSHAVTSGIMARKNLELLEYSLAGNLLAVAQGTDLRGGPELLSPKTKVMYHYIRSIADFAAEDKPLHVDIENIAASIRTGTMSELVRKDIFTDQ